MVSGDPNLGEGEGGRLADTRSTRKADGSGVMMFRKNRLYQQSTKETVQYHRAVPPVATILSMDRE